jgi:hypothetical protein
MALLIGVLGGGAMEMRCPVAPAASLLGGMVPMYALMSAFHTAPWLRLAAACRARARGPAGRENWTFATKFRKLIQHRRAKRAR